MGGDLKLPGFLAATGSALAMFRAAACETVAVLPGRWQRINSGSQSGIIVPYKTHAWLQGSAINIANVATGQIDSLAVHGGGNWVNAGRTW